MTQWDFKSGAKFVRWRFFMNLKSFWLAGLLGVSMCAAAQTTVSIAADAASKEDVQKLFNVMASREQMHQMMQQLVAQMQSMTREQIKKQHPETSEQELARLDRQSQDLMNSFPLDEMLNDMVPIYQRHFTKSDITALTEFYSSPTGQKFLHEMPAVTGETMRAVLPRIQAEVEGSLKRADEKRPAPQK
jgi:uncharacterized protein